MVVLHKVQLWANQTDRPSQFVPLSSTITTAANPPPAVPPHRPSHPPRQSPNPVSSNLPITKADHQCSTGSDKLRTSDPSNKASLSPHTIESCSSARATSPSPHRCSATTAATAFARPASTASPSSSTNTRTSPRLSGSSGTRA